MLMPVMRIRKTKSPYHALLQECLNITAPDDPEVASKLLGIVSQCVVCGAEMHPLASHVSLQELRLSFTCSKESCVGNPSAVSAMQGLNEAFIRTYMPNQTHLF